MELHTRTFDNVLVLAPAGRIDHTNCDRFLEAIQPHVERCTASGPRLVFDLGQLEYVSSAGLRVFGIARKRLQARGGQVAFLNMQPQIEEVFEIVKALPGMSVFASVADLDRYLAARQRKHLEG